MEGKEAGLPVLPKVATESCSLFLATHIRHRPVHVFDQLRAFRNLGQHVKMATGGESSTNSATSTLAVKKSASEWKSNLLLIIFDIMDSVSVF